MKKKLSVAVLMGGPSSEHEVSLLSGANIIQAMRSNDNLSQYVVTPIKFRKPRELLNKLITKKFDVVFPIVHGTFGEDGTLQALLETLDLPYVGSGVLSSALCMDKVLSQELLSQRGLFTPLNLAVGPLSYPCVMKPRFGGSSVGVSIVKSKKELARAIKKAEKEGEVITQKYIKGREFTCGVLEFTKGNLSALPVTEIIPHSKFFDFKAKYTKGGSEEITPARIPANITREIQNAALLAHKTLGCRHISRSDFILSARGKPHFAKASRGTLYYLETNTLPGMTDTSLTPQAAAAVGLSMHDLVHRLIKSALIE